MQWKMVMSVSFNHSMPINAKLKIFVKKLSFQSVKFKTKRYRNVRNRHYGPAGQRINNNRKCFKGFRFWRGTYPNRFYCNREWRQRAQSKVTIKIKSAGPFGDLRLGGHAFRGCDGVGVMPSICRCRDGLFPCKCAFNQNVHYFMNTGHVIKILAVNTLINGNFVLIKSLMLFNSSCCLFRIGKIT